MSPWLALIAPLLSDTRFAGTFHVDPWSPMHAWRADGQRDKRSLGVISGVYLRFWEAQQPQIRDLDTKPAALGRLVQRYLTPKL
jgi:hypothetical protein